MECVLEVRASAMKDGRVLLVTALLVITAHLPSTIARTTVSVVLGTVLAPTGPVSVTLAFVAPVVTLFALLALEIVPAMESVLEAPASA
jgi:hypothetical protein